MDGQVIIVYLQSWVWIIQRLPRESWIMGEFAWLENMRKYSRMKNGGDNKDHRVMGGNPCLEQSLESYELCCLVETFPDNHDSLEDYQRTLKYAYLYAKTVTLVEHIGVIPIV